VNVLGSELEALRIDVLRGRAAAALPEIDSRLGRLRAWWEATRRGESVPEAPDAEVLGRALISALDIANDAHMALEQWQPALDRRDEKTAVKRARGASEHDLAIDRFNRYFPLLRLGRLAEAQQELEHCLEGFERAGDEAGRARVLGALADLSDKKGDRHQAAALARRGLAVCNTLPDPGDRAISHRNLGNYLERAGEVPEATAHELAALLYDLATGHGQGLQTAAHNHAVRLRRARRSGRDHTLPRVADLLARPGFAPLRDWLAAEEIGLEQLQNEVDAFVARCRTLADQPQAQESA
jgi:tetratricopeptide (TPR) repeat protein